MTNYLIRRKFIRKTVVADATTVLVSIGVINSISLNIKDI
jgi:hypothetical protein